jgi:membrane-associated phospholipid phosphatase
MDAPARERIAVSARGVAAAVLLSLGSVFFLDERIALWVERTLLSGSAFSRFAAEVPDLLLPAVVVASGWMWVSYAWRLRRNLIDPRTRFYRAAGTAMPLAYAAKTILKFIFGRTNTSAWLENPAADTFDWFHGGGVHNGFPSGHMTVFTSLAVTACFFFPRYRNLLLLAVLALGVAMIATDSHFLSDVIAGGYLGFAVAAAVLRTEVLPRTGKL